MEENIIGYFTNLQYNETGDVIIALDGDRIVGYISIYVKTQSYYWKVKKVGVISGLMVHPKFRRRGIARKLLSKAEKYFGRKSVKYYTVYTTVNNQNAITFYENNGLKPLHTTLIGEISDPIQKEEMVKPR
jgi:ribosomal protein S18 acetylase RimI-like enzyme